MLGPVPTLAGHAWLLGAAPDAGAPLLRLSWAWGALLAVGLLAGLALFVLMRRLRRIAHPARPSAAPTVVTDAWAESARRVRPDDPGAPREPGRS